MRSAAAVAVLMLLCAMSAIAQPLAGRAQASWESYDTGRMMQTGFRQSYDVRLDRGFTANSRLRLFFRADDFRGSTEMPITNFVRESTSREYQPSGEFVIDTDTIRLLVRGDYIDSRGSSDYFTTDRTTERIFANMQWTPIGLPTFSVNAQRTAMKDPSLQSEPTDESASASVQYPWRGLSTAVDLRYARTADPGAGYDRKLSTLTANAGYALSVANGRYGIFADAVMSRSRIDERATGGHEASIPVQVTPPKALFGVDDTPTEHRDHPLSPYPLLRDSDINTSANIDLGPDGVSFYNIALDLGRVERLDEIRITVRDAAGNPLRGGGGPVTFDAYVSDDGNVWRLIADAQTTFDGTRSAYLVTFPLLTTRWVQVVNFGVQSERCFITEAQAFYHVRIDPASARNGQQETRGATLALNAQPFENLRIGYGGSYTAMEQEFAALASIASSSIDHGLSIQYDLAERWKVRAEAAKRDARLYGVANESGTSLVAALDYRPTRRLQLSFEANRHQQQGVLTPSSLMGYSFHLNGQPVRAVSLTFDAGVQQQEIEGETSAGRRTFANLTMGARVTRTVRMLLSAALQRATSTSDDPATLLLGAQRGDRASAEFIWQPGRPLLVSTRIGYVSSSVSSGFTQRVRVEWSPFAGGAVSFVGTFDEDIDPMSDRRARRLVFAPRWAMNRFVTFDFNYTAVSSSTGTRNDEQKTLFASVTVSK